jgi:putative hydrolase of HD superfamily
MLRDLWEEFESGHTPEARFANSLDRFQPMLHNIVTHGKSWHEHGIRKSQVVAKNQVMEAGSNRLWEYISRALSDAVSNGHLSE